MSDSVPAPAGEAPDVQALALLALEVVRMNRAFRGAPLDASAEVLETLPDKAEWEATFDALEAAALGASGAPGRDATGNEIRLGDLPSVNIRHGVAYSYCPECGTEAGPRASRGLPAAPPEENIDGR